MSLPLYLGLGLAAPTVHGWRVNALSQASGMGSPAPFCEGHGDWRFQGEPLTQGLPAPVRGPGARLLCPALCAWREW